ncbi:putative 1-phosphatidylinositol 3-phosphate 5-kinase isoform X9 [Uranotaenia lowii]|uniref:putative 1-phosphatidylinositol 3-phosphate 5-kinase isoform X9 n=1 Tax=Uranotaenia lowii TaxID=190385 RepID=UPI0024794AEC|nr:putative 1-phosphatidylinositol 3-phosphate 5-kinase isoform X9 [Uranotaenia lowii]
MNLNLHSSTLLTEFAREKSNELESLFSKVVSKMTPGVYDNTGTGSLCAAPITEATNKIDSQIDQHSSGMTNNAQEEAIGRTSVNVIKHLSTIVNQKNLNYKKYKNTELQKLWMPDSTSIECYECSVKFSTFKRKHHCRLCGQIFCTKCCNQVVPGKIINCTDDLKVCTYCSKVVLMYLNSSNTAEDLKSDLKAFQEDLSNKLLPIQMVQNDESGRLTNKKEITVGYREERIVSNQINILSSADRKAILQQSNSLRTLFEEMVDFLPNQNHGFELIAFLVTAQKTSNNRQAMAILGAMIEAGYLLPLDVASTNSESFVDFNENDKNEVALFDDNAVYVFAPNKEATASSAEITEVAETDVIGQTAEDRLLQPETKENTQKEITYNDQEKCFIFSTGATVLLEAFCQHEDSLVNQLLHLNNLDVSWSKILIPIAARVANTMNPHTLADSMDIRHNVCFKKLPGGDRKECAILEGVCFTKNVVHRQMLARINNPKVLLLECSIAFQRVESKFVSFDTLMLQEKDYLKKKVSKILTWGANIVLVHKNVAGIAQEMLRSNGITLITDVKLSTLERIARCLDCDLLTSIDSNVGQPKLGTCDNFDIQRYNTDEVHRVHKRITDIGDVPKSGKNYVYKEALDIFNHQQLSVLFYSFYYNPNLPSSYCAQPSLLNMQFYGQNDIMLGDFLERYCFRSSHLCKSCNLPMMDHIRRYAHLQGYVQVDLKEDKNKLDTSAIVLTSKCKLCQKQISSQLSRDTWRLSFAKYLELRFCGHTYTCRNFENGKACKHSLHKDYIHYFTYKGVLAIFTYYSVNVWDICFPEMTYKSFDLKSISVELKILTSKGYDGFAKIVDKICDLAIEPDIYEKFLRKVNFDKTNFQRDIDTVESLVRNNSSIENVEDALLLLKKTMLENLDDCAFQLNSLSSRTEIDDKDKKESDRKGSRVLMDTTWNECAAVADLSDRARVKSNCLFPIMIHEQDLSSYIAYALTSSNYQIALDQLNADKTTDLCSNPVKQPIECSDNNDETFSKIDSTESKRSQKLNCHVDIPCQDGDHNFSCKIYFAKEFSKLRSLLITDPLTGDLKKRQYCKCNRVHCDNAITRKFARSLLRSFPWDARGGKSGSKFSKTIDDRFILKEMSRTDVTIFENFAPYLFDYIHDCLKYNQPTLLAKIFGIFKVTVKTKESTSIEKTVLVMENLFCNKNISRKFDLKGSLRNRLVDPQNQSGEVVLLDENFLQMSWKNPLYVLSNTHTVLHECIERDSSFLEKNGVMDYSLLLGINDDQSSLFVGIIDYIRTFTLDKKVESMLKQSVIMGGHGKLPTVISPKMYKNRFREAMNRYFLLMPDRWGGLAFTESARTDESSKNIPAKAEEK